MLTISVIVLVLWLLGADRFLYSALKSRPLHRY